MVWQSQKVLKYEQSNLKAITFINLLIKNQIK